MTRLTLLLPLPLFTLGACAGATPPPAIALDSVRFQAAVREAEPAKPGGKTMPEHRVRARRCKAPDYHGEGRQRRAPHAERLQAQGGPSPQGKIGYQPCGPRPGVVQSWRKRAVRHRPDQISASALSRG